MRRRPHAPVLLVAVTTTRRQKPSGDQRERSHREERARLQLSPASVSLVGLALCFRALLAFFSLVFSVAGHVSLPIRTM
jgi:hypothetical protein